MPVRSRPEDDLMNMNTSKKQEGYVVIVVAALLAALTGFLALAVDYRCPLQCSDFGSGGRRRGSPGRRFHLLTLLPGLAATANCVKPRAPGGPQQFGSGSAHNRSRHERQRQCCESARHGGCAVHSEYVLCPGPWASNREHRRGRCGRGSGIFDGNVMRQAMVYSEHGFEFQGSL